MTKPTDDLSKDPFNSDDLPKDQSFTDNVMDVAVDKAKDAAGDYVRDAPKRMGRRFLWSLILSFTLVDEWEKERLLNRAERGGKITLHEALFGSKFSVSGLVKTIVFLVIVVVIVFYLWQQGFVEMFMEQQEILDQIQGTSTP